MSITKRNYRIYAIIIAFMLMLVAPAHAGVVTIQTEMATQLKGRDLEIIAKVSNQGNAMARDFHLVLEALGQEHQGQWVSAQDVLAGARTGGVEALLSYNDVRLRNKSETLSPGQAVLWKARFTLSKNISGTYPAILRIAYKDEHSQEFSSLAGIVFRTPEGLASTMSANITQEPGKNSTRLIVEVDHKGSTPNWSTGLLVLPISLACDNPVRDFEMQPHEKTVLDFTVENQTDLAGTHAVFFVLEYDDNGLHHTVLKSTSVVVKARPHWFSRTRPWWIGLSAVLAVLFALAWIRAWRLQR